MQMNQMWSRCQRWRVGGAVVKRQIGLRIALSARSQ